MKTVTVASVLALCLLGVSTLAQGTDDATDRLRACSLMGQAERLTCLNQLAADIGSPPAGTAIPSAEGRPPSSAWIVSETTSPVDYSPVIVATALSSSGHEGAPLRFAIQCRGGGTDLLFTSPALTRRGENYVLSYVLSERAPVKVAAGSPGSAAGVAVLRDVVRLLTSFPDQGEITVRIAAPDGFTIEGRYRLDDLKVVRDRLAVPCRWPIAAVPSRN